MVGCSKDLIISSCSLHVSFFLLRSFSSVAIFVFAIVSSLFRNSSWTDFGLGVDFALLFFWVVEIWWDGLLELEKLKEGKDGGRILEVMVNGVKAGVKDIVEGVWFAILMGWGFGIEVWVEEVGWLEVRGEEKGSIGGRVKFSVRLNWERGVINSKKTGHCKRSLFGLIWIRMLPEAFGMHLGCTWRVGTRRRLRVVLGHISMTDTTEVWGELHRLHRLLMLLLLQMLFNPLSGQLLKCVVEGSYVILLINRGGFKQKT